MGNVRSVWLLMAFAGVAGCSGHSPGSGPGLEGGGHQGGTSGSPITPCPPGTGGAAGQPGCSIPTGPAGTWVEIPAPPGQSGFYSTDAFAVGQDDLLFAGATYDPSMGFLNARLLRWTHGCWTVELSFPAGSTPPDSPSVHGTGPSDLWASASDVLFHRDAQGWTRFTDESWRDTVRQPPSYVRNNGTIEFNRVRAAAANDLWIAATSNMLHWSNESWTTYNFDSPTYPTGSAAIGFYFSDIWIDSPSSVTSVGETDQVGNTMSPGAIHHFDGASWTHTFSAVGNIAAVWGGGNVLWLAQPSEDDLTMRAFNGTTATPVQIAGVDPTQRLLFLSNMFGRGPSDIWAAGEDVAHFDGQGWSLVSDVPPSAHGTTDFPVNTFVTGDAASTWLVTPGPRFFRKVTGP
jgi:hypothetical protein